VEITVPHGRSRRSTDLVVVHQSRSRLDQVIRDGLPCTSTARTVVDVACTMTSRDDVRALVSDAVQRGLSSLLTLARETERAPRHGRGFLGAALEEAEAGARPAGEARLLRLLRQAHLPLPAINAPIHLGRQTYVADALWTELRLIVEIDGAAWHLNARSWDRDLRRQNALQAAGFVVLRFPYSRLAQDPAGVIQDIRWAMHEPPVGSRRSWVLIVGSLWDSVTCQTT
jgi:very-short-patch-repair endonuclease